MDWPFVRTYIEREEVESTSDLARTILEHDPPELPLLVRTRKQTKGRGRGENVWYSDSGSLTFTLGIDPAFHGLSPRHEPCVALATAVAIVQTLAPAFPLGIRWPNDIEADSRKVGGILPEKIEAPFGPRLLVGIGLNVTTALENAPAEVRGLAISLHELLPQARWDQDVLLRTLLLAIDTTWQRLSRDDPTLAHHWAQLDTLLGKPLRIDHGPRIVVGVGSGIDPEGAMNVLSEGRMIRLWGGRILREK